MEWSNIEVVQPITGAGVTCLFMWMTWGQVPLFTLHSTGGGGAPVVKPRSGTTPAPDKCYRIEKCK